MVFAWSICVGYVTGRAVRALCSHNLSYPRHKLNLQDQASGRKGFVQESHNTPHLTTRRVWGIFRAVKEMGKQVVQLEEAKRMDELSGRAPVEPITKKSTLWEMFHGIGDTNDVASPVHQTTVTDE